MQRFVPVLAVNGERLLNPCPVLRQLLASCGLHGAAVGCHCLAKQLRGPSALSSLCLFGKCPAQIIHGGRVACIGGLLVPLAGLVVILGDTPAVLIQPAQVEHGGRVACMGGLLVPLVGLAVILGDARPFWCSQPKLFMARALPASAPFWYHSRALP